MLHEEALRQEVDDAMRQPRARYLVTAIIDGNEIDAGEAVIGPDSDGADCCQTITRLVAASLHRLFMTVEQQNSLRLVIEDVPLLY